MNITPLIPDALNTALYAQLGAFDLLAYTLHDGTPYLLLKQHESDIWLTFLSVEELELAVDSGTLDMYAIPF